MNVAADIGTANVMGAIDTSFMKEKNETAIAQVEISTGNQEEICGRGHKGMRVVSERLPRRKADDRNSRLPRRQSQRRRQRVQRSQRAQRKFCAFCATSAT